MVVHASLGDRGPIVAEVRARLVRLGYLPNDGGGVEFDQSADRAVRAFQQERRISVDGVVGPTTFRHLEEARWRLGDRVLWYSAAHPHVGDDVEDLQRRLSDLGFSLGRVDGIFGSSTDAALREFQRNVGMTADGTCGWNTVVALQRLDRTVKGGTPERLWDEHAHAANRTGITDKMIVLDPGHGGVDPGVEGHGLSEAVIAEDLARRIEGRLAAIGTQVLLTRPPTRFLDREVTEAERAAMANDVAADLVISLHADGGPSQRLHGAATYYYGSARNASELGRSFAAIVQSEIIRRTDLVDCHSHPKTWDMLRLTSMPTVRVEVGYLTHAGDAARLSQPRFRDTLAEAIAAAAVSFFSPIDEPDAEQ
ncbi:MAG: N-acetylmuramoyl-L-alanine amidase [Actinomycetota bacterium]|nr:N-acetylmuramoyl-L-alanine amidase [Actinomycetota bacterium]